MTGPIVQIWDNPKDDSVTYVRDERDYLSDDKDDHYTFETYDAEGHLLESGELGAEDPPGVQRMEDHFEINGL